MGFYETDPETGEEIFHPDPTMDGGGSGAEDNGDSVFEALRQVDLTDLQDQKVWDTESDTSWQKDLEEEASQHHSVNPSDVPTIDGPGTDVPGIDPELLNPDNDIFIPID